MLYPRALALAEIGWNGTKTMTELGDELMKEIKEVADGKLTKAEALGYTEMAIARVCNYM